MPQDEPKEPKLQKKTDNLPAHRNEVRAESANRSKIEMKFVRELYRNMRDHMNKRQVRNQNTFVQQHGSSIMDTDKDEVSGTAPRAMD